jgi:ATP-dependent Clp protease adaptor protein ClpS
MYGMKTKQQEAYQTDLLEAVEDINLKDLVVFNDDFNTFDHVIATLYKSL